MAQANLPARPHLEYLKKLAKERLAAVRAAGDAGASLADAQLAVARAYGFASWRKLRAYVDAVRDVGAALVSAVRAGDDGAVAAILDRHPALVDATTDPDRRVLPSDAAAMRLIHVAVAEDRPAVAKLLVARGANINLRNADGRLPLHDCFELGRGEIRQLLLDAGATLDVPAAAMLGRHDELRALLRADPALADDRTTHLAPLGWCGYGWQDVSARILCEHGATLDRPPFDHDAMHAAASVAAAGVVRVLLAHRADPNWRTPAGDTAMHVAIKSRIVDDPADFVRAMLAGGADPSLRNRAGRTPLDEAIVLQGTDAEDYVTRQPTAAKRLAETIRSRLP